MTSRRVTVAALLSAALTACGSEQAHERGGSAPTPRRGASTRVASEKRATPQRPPQALVTDEKENQLLVVDLPSGRIARRVPLPGDPEDLAASPSGGFVVVTSGRAGKVTVLNRATLRRVRTFGGFHEPHIVEISPDGQRAYVTDDARGALTVIRLSDMKVTSTVAVGAGAHHLTISRDERRLWVALSESAARITILGLANPDHPRVIGAFSPGFAAHDLSFAPSGRQIWITAASGPDTTVFGVRRRRVLDRVTVGAPPQHLAFAGRYAYLTSGYGDTIEKVNALTGSVVARASAPYGSFELDAADGYVTTSSLLRGTLAIYTPSLRLLRVVKLAPATREVAISRP